MILQVLPISFGEQPSVGSHVRAIGAQSVPIPTGAKYVGVAQARRTDIFAVVFSGLLLSDELDVFAGKVVPLPENPSLEINIPGGDHFYPRDMGVNWFIDMPSTTLIFYDSPPASPPPIRETSEWRFIRPACVGTPPRLATHWPSLGARSGGIAWTSHESLPATYSGVGNWIGVTAHNAHISQVGWNASDPPLLPYSYKPVCLTMETLAAYSRNQNTALDFFRLDAARSIRLSSQSPIARSLSSGGLLTLSRSPVIRGTKGWYLKNVPIAGIGDFVSSANCIGDDIAPGEYMRLSGKCDSATGTITTYFYNFHGLWREGDGDLSGVSKTVGNTQTTFAPNVEHYGSFSVYRHPDAVAHRLNVTTATCSLSLRFDPSYGGF